MKTSFKGTLRTCHQREHPGPEVTRLSASHCRGDPCGEERDFPGRGKIDNCIWFQTREGREELAVCRVSLQTNSLDYVYKNLRPEIDLHSGVNLPSTTSFRMRHE